MTRDRSIARLDGGAYVGFAASAEKLLYDIVQMLRIRRRCWTVSFPIRAQARQ